MTVLRAAVLLGYFLSILLTQGCAENMPSAPAAPSPPLLTAPVPDDWNDQLWRELVFGLADGRNVQTNTSKVLATRPTAVDVYVQDDPFFRARESDIVQVFDLIAEELFGTSWTGTLAWAETPPKARGQLSVTINAAVAPACAVANLGASVGVIEFNPDCDLSNPLLFRGVLGHELGHALGFYHDTLVVDGQPGLMNATLHGSNPPRYGSAALRAEARVAQCAYELGRGARYAGPDRPEACR